jgi:hypothetical protein
VELDPEPAGQLAAPGDREHENRPFVGEDVAGDQRESRPDDEETPAAVTNPVNRYPVGNHARLGESSTSCSGPHRRDAKRRPDREPADFVTNPGVV